MKNEKIISANISLKEIDDGFKFLNNGQEIFETNNNFQKILNLIETIIREILLKIIALVRVIVVFIVKTYFNNENIFSNFISSLLKVDFSSVFTYDLNGEKLQILKAHLHRLLLIMNF